MTGLATATSEAPLLAACRAERELLDASPRVWVALSGGADSTALLHAILAISVGAPVSVTHIDHGVQDASLHWAEHCRDLCRQLGVPLDVHRLTPPANGRFAGGFEAWARSERYAHWQHLLGSGELLLCAHHADDQAETVALRLLQGRLPLPMPKRRRLGAGLLLRPFLELRREQLTRALGAWGHQWLEDPSNENTRLLRNRVRALLPQLACHERWSVGLRRCGELVERQQLALARAVGQQPVVLKPEGQDSPEAAGELTRLPLSAIAGVAVLQGLLALFGSGPVTGAQARSALLQLQKQAALDVAGGASRGGVRVGTGGLALFAAGVDLVVWREPEFLPQTLEGVRSYSRSEEVLMPHGTLTLEFAAAAPAAVAPAAGGVSQDQETESGSPLVVRPLQPADRILCNGRSRKVRELLRASGVPRWARASYPVLAQGDDVVAVPAPVATGGTGWMRDGSGKGIPVSACWSAKLPS